MSLKLFACLRYFIVVVVAFPFSLQARDSEVYGTWSCSLDHFQGELSLSPNGYFDYQDGECWGNRKCRGRYWLSGDTLRLLWWHLELSRDEAAARAGSADSFVHSYVLNDSRYRLDGDTLRFLCGRGGQILSQNGPMYRSMPTVPRYLHKRIRKFARGRNKEPGLFITW